jgi:uncharacterized zinc-type alcohol dehydrogenase-like protein
VSRTEALGFNNSNLEPLKIEIDRRDLRESDLKIEILYCGICHSDLHMIKNEWNSTTYPVVPGHEIVGRVKEKGGDVQAFQIGDLVAVGCIIGSCENCPSCLDHLEQYCDKGFTLVFNTLDKTSKLMNYGGFSKEIVVNQKYVIPIPSGFRMDDLPKLAPLLCAGITTYSPLKHFGATNGKNVAILGLGGLGHMAVKIAKALGSSVSVITHSPEKALVAKEEFSVDNVILTTASDWNKSFLNKFDIILDTVCESLDLNLYLTLLKTNGVLVIVGIPGKPFQNVYANSLIPKRRSLAGSLIGSISETKEMLEFAVKNQILADVELISANHMSEALKRLEKSDVKYRFVIDMKTL